MGYDHKETSQRTRQNGSQRSGRNHRPDGAAADRRQLAPPRRPDRSRPGAGAEERRLPPLPARKPAVLARRSRAVDELLLQQPDRRARHAPDRYRARPQGRLQQGRQEARPPARGQGAYRGPAMDRRRRPERAAPSLPTPSAKSTGASANSCPKICYGSRTRRPKRRSRSSPANCVTAMSQSGTIFPSARPPCRASCKRFEEVYSKLGKTETIIATAAAHHRLAWIHPFLDGNGRVARLMSHATLLEALDTGAVWSIARGLARNVDAYKGHLAACDLPRRNDLDGRGHLSEETLAEFTRFFLTTCLDQVTFMERLMQPRPVARAHPAVGGRGNPPRQAAAQIRRYPRSRALSRRTPARAIPPASSAPANAGSPCRLRADRTGRAYVRKHARAAAPRFPRNARKEETDPNLGGVKLPYYESYFRKI